MEHSLKILTMAAGLVMTCVFIGFSLLMMREGKQLGQTFLKELKEEETWYGENKWTRYDGALVSGAEVINAIRRFQKDLSIVVNNNIRMDEYSNVRIFRISENLSFSPSYIEPFDDYIGQVMRETNGKIKAIWFTKRG